MKLDASVEGNLVYYFCRGDGIWKGIREREGEGGRGRARARELGLSLQTHEGNCSMF